MTILKTHLDRSSVLALVLFLGYLAVPFLA